MHRRFFSFVVSLLLLAGCAVAPTPIKKNKIDSLAYMLHTLDRDIPMKKAILLSRDIFYKTKELSNEFELTSPPLWHNFLVNIGVRQKGLCFHWADALYYYLKSKNYQAYDFHLVGANIGDYFSEHNALVIVTDGIDVKDGVVIDPWRNSGDLYFSKSKEDPKYHWHHRLDRGCE